jgi:YbbR domain-containing protein
VEIKNEESITNQGKIYEVLNGTDTIDVIIKANRTIVDSLSRENIKATADLEDLTLMDTVAIQLSSNKYNDKLESITSITESLKLNIENMQKTQLVVNCETVGEPESGYMIGNITTDQNIVRLSGPESAISKVSKAIASINVAGMTSDISTAVDLKLYDEEGNIVDTNGITTNISSVNVNVEILARVTVPLTYTTLGMPATGYLVSGDITSTPGTVVIAGKKSIIDTINSIEISDINVTGQSSNMTTIVNVKDYLPSGVSYVGKSSDSNITIQVGIEKELTATFGVPSKNITLANLPAGLKGTISDLDDTVEIQITGLANIVSALNENTIVGVVDINEMETLLGVATIEAGVYNTDVIFQIPEGAQVITPLAVQVTIQEKEDTKSTSNNSVSGNTAGN